MIRRRLYDWIRPHRPVERHPVDERGMVAFPVSEPIPRGSYFVVVVGSHATLYIRRWRWQRA